MPTPKLPTDKKEYNPKDPNPCHLCSNCCEYVATQIDKPITIRDFDQVLWYLLHKDIWVYIDEENDWYIQFNTFCEKLSDWRCTYYPQRPQLCRDYEPKHCMRYGDEDDEQYLFKNEIDLFCYLIKKRPKTFDKLKKKVNLPFTKKEILKTGNEQRKAEKGVHS